MHGLIILYPSVSLTMAAYPLYTGLILNMAQPHITAGAPPQRFGLNSYILVDMAGYDISTLA